MAIPAAGELGSPTITVAEFQQKIEDLREEVAKIASIEALNASFTSQISTLNSELDAVESDVLNKLSAITAATATSIWSGSSSSPTDLDSLGIANHDGTYIISFKDVSNNDVQGVLFVTNSSLPETKQVMFLESSSGIRVYVGEYYSSSGGAIKVRCHTLPGGSSANTFATMTITEIFKV